jgi:hypothetical protein
MSEVPCWSSQAWRVVDELTLRRLFGRLDADRLDARAAQVAKLRRTITRKGRRTVEIVYPITSAGTRSAPFRTHHTRPRTPAGLEEPPPRHPPRRGTSPHRQQGGSRTTPELATDPHSEVDHGAGRGPHPSPLAGQAGAWGAVWLASRLPASDRRDVPVRQGGGGSAPNALAGPRCVPCQRGVHGGPSPRGSTSASPARRVPLSGSGFCDRGLVGWSGLISLAWAGVLLRAWHFVGRCGRGGGCLSCGFVWCRGVLVRWCRSGWGVGQVGWVLLWAG